MRADSLTVFLLDGIVEVGSQTENLGACCRQYTDPYSFGKLHRRGGGREEPSAQGTQRNEVTNTRRPGSQECSEQ